MKFNRVKIFFTVLVFSIVILNNSAFTQSAGKSQNGTFYVPAYSSIFHSDLKWEFNLTVTLSIHNIDMKNSIIIDSIDYYNSAGKIIHSYIRDKKIYLQPMETYNLGIMESDVRGGIGANFIVKWHSTSKSNRPVIETIMISTRGQQGISFTSRGVAVED